MSARKIRRAVAHQALKAARKAGFAISLPTPIVAAAPETTMEAPSLPQSGSPCPSPVSTSPTRYNGDFLLLGVENASGFEAYRLSMLQEHAPSTPTETILVNAMVESHWLFNRAERMLNTCIDQETGKIVDPQTFSLYLRVQSTHGRAFHKALSQLFKLRSEKRKEQRGVEAQKLQNEIHAWKKEHHYWEIMRKDGEACHQISANTLENLKAAAEFPAFEAQYSLELAKHGLKEEPGRFATQAA